MVKLNITENNQGRRLMQNNDRLLEIISNETKEDICKRDVVTPEIFQNIFMNYAQKHDLKNYEETADNYLQQKMNNFLHLQDETSEHANKLSQTTSKAIEAIEEKNQDSLQEVLTETKNLRNEIEKLKESLFKDELTGVYNRKWLYEHYMLENSSQFKTSGTIVLIDLNYFKLVNDTYGHIVGDKVLVFVANTLKKSGGDVVRYGGDEFIILFENNKDETIARKKLYKIREDMIKKHLKLKDTEFRICFSYGITTFEKNDSLELIIEKADKYMYEDKVKIKQRIKGIDV